MTRCEHGSPACSSCYVKQKYNEHSYHERCTCSKCSNTRTDMILEEMNKQREAEKKAETLAYNAVNHPIHYTQGEVECIDAIKAATIALSGEEAYCTGAAIKYLWRWKAKGTPKQDLEKARWYINRLLGEKQ